jgi:hypothetical protein
MNLVYIDESGNTGLNLKDAQQPIFVLAGMVVPEPKWFLIERDFLAKVREYWPGTAPYSIEISAKNLKNRRGAFREKSLEEQLSFRDEILDLLIRNDISIIYRRIIKEKFRVFCEEKYGAGYKSRPLHNGNSFLVHGGGPSSKRKRKERIRNAYFR